MSNKIQDLAVQLYNKLKGVLDKGRSQCLTIFCNKDYTVYNSSLPACLQLKITELVFLEEHVHFEVNLPECEEHEEFSTIVDSDDDYRSVLLSNKYGNFLVLSFCGHFIL